MPLAEGIHILNPGSVGQPNDGDLRAAYLLFDTYKKTVEFRRVKYDTRSVVDRLYNHCYAPSLAERIETEGKGRSNIQNFHSIYKKPEWGLEAIS